MRYIDKEYVENILKDYNNGEKISRRKDIFYKSNVNTLKDDVYYILNEKEKIEWAKCYNSVEYFIETYLNITLRTYQKEWIKLYQENKFIIYNVARQTGYNTIITALYLHDMIFNSRKILHQTVKRDIAIEINNLIKKYYIILPYFLKPGIIDLKNNIFIFNNDSYIFYNKEDLSRTYNLYSLHDFAHHSNPDKIYKDTLSCVSENHNSQLIIQSTPNGNNLFYKLYQDSVRKENDPLKNVYKSIMTFWYEVDGRDENWAKEEIKRLGSEEIFNQEHYLMFINKIK